MSDPFDDESYDEFLAACAKDCFCCDRCGNQVPCAGVTAGGVCDRMCHCREIDDEETHDDT
jgi:hypothetical protein